MKLTTKKKLGINAFCYVVRDVVMCVDLATEAVSQLQMDEFAAFIRTNKIDDQYIILVNIDHETDMLVPLFRHKLSPIILNGRLVSVGEIDMDTLIDICYKLCVVATNMANGVETVDTETPLSPDDERGVSEGLNY